MDILMITPEAMPFASTGGLAESVTSLSSALVDKGHNVKILMPRYYGISKDILTQLEGSLGVPSEFQEICTAIYTTSIKTKNENDLQFYFVDYEDYFGREGIYGSENEPNYEDNPQRFS
ncbi:MAG: glycogen/starch synthase [Spirochaetaceae bacterium]|nr:glycogen/starch synthase [Spirochaetaceae bacterium]